MSMLGTPILRLAPSSAGLRKLLNWPPEVQCEAQCERSGAGTLNKSRSGYVIYFYLLYSRLKLGTAVGRLSHSYSFS